MNVALRPELHMLSICTGGGGLDLGIELAVPRARTVCMVEREAFAVAQLVSAMEAGHLAPAPVWSDARTFDGLGWRGCVDGLIGGIPCQPHSMAGRKRGSHDERDLWSTARRIIVQSRVWFVLIENVEGMLSPGDDEVAGAERVWRDLRKLGFQVEGGLFSAAEVGASHERERVFILGVANTEREQWGEGWSDSSGAGGPYAQPSGSGADVLSLADAIGSVPDRRRAGSLSGSRSAAEREAQGQDWQRRGNDAGDGCEGARSIGLAHASGPRGQARLSRQERSGQEGIAGQFVDSGDALVHAAFIGRGEGRAEPSIRSGRDAASGASDAMGDANVVELRREPSAGEQPLLQPEHGLGAWPLFPPGPSDRENWKAVLERAPELEPAFRRVADGLASRLDIARVDRLRLLGNGVVPLQAAHAFRTLATRLAGRGSAGAARLVRMMAA